MLFELEDGTPLLIRPIRPDDKDLLASGLGLLSEDARFKRFLTAKPHFTTAELRYLTEVDGIDHVAYVVLRGDEPRQLVAVARLVRDRARPQVAEVAVTVGDAYQQRGIGTRLGTLLASAARARGVRFLSATMAADNEPAHRLFAHISSRLSGARTSGVDELWADLAAA